MKTKTINLVWTKGLMKTKKRIFDTTDSLSSNVFNVWYFVMYFGMRCMPLFRQPIMENQRKVCNVLVF